MEYIAQKPTKDYKVLIKCMTYNQEEYIEDALKGFVRQKTNFPFCALVVDDCSTDATAEIIKQYEQDYPDIIKGIYLPVNMYGNPDKQNYIKPWEKRTQYIAYCEGDDYWIDDYKLQRQVDFLDTHPEYMMHFHNAIVRFENHNRPDRLISNFQSGDFDTALLFEKWQLPLASVLFRNEILYSKELAELNKVKRGGFCLFIAASLLGKVYGLSECLSIYRKNDGGVSNSMSLADCTNINFGFAKASGNKGAMKVMNNRAYNAMKNSAILFVFGKKAVIEMKQVVDSYDKTIFYRALLWSIFNFPFLVIRKIRNYYRAKLKY